MSVSDLVGEIDDVRRRTRRARSGAAVPLALLGLLVAAAAPVYGAAARSTVVDAGELMEVDLSALQAGPTFLNRFLRVHPNVTNFRGIGVYWLLAAPLVFAAIAWYYARRARRTGLSVDGWRVAAAGAGAFAALVLTMATAGALSRVGPDELSAGNFLNPFLVVAAGVFVLAWVERSVVAALAGVVFLGGVLLGDVGVYSDVRDEGWYRIGSWGYYTLALGGWLLLSAAVAAITQRVRRG